LGIGAFGSGDRVGCAGSGWLSGWADLGFCMVAWVFVWLVDLVWGVGWMYLFDAFTLRF
jgi:hypothetical protein